MLIDTTFNVFSDAKGGDPDRTSPTLRKYHKILWSKLLPNGKLFELTDEKKGEYLYHNTDLGEFYLGSDAITHSYKNHRFKKWLTDQIPDDVDELFNAGSTIGAYIVFPNNRVNGKHTINQARGSSTIGAYIVFPNNRVNGKHTINQARGINSLIDDRFDLTLECIRLFYSGLKSPLFDTLMRYKYFFDLFHNFKGYIDFFLLNDLVDDNQRVKFYLPFDDFKTKPTFSGVEEYLKYKNRAMTFIKLRNVRIEMYLNQRMTEQNASP